MKKYKIREIVRHAGNAVFLVEFDNNYDLAMTFLRYQEYYESASPKFRGKIFTILDYMDWYSKGHGGSFTYPTDWAGFNIPDWVINDVMVRIPDRNKYDHRMHEIASTIRVKLQKDKTYGGKFYLIGAMSGDMDVIEHELAHGLYYVNEQYKKDMLDIIKRVPKKQADEMYAHFKQMGYAKGVWKDEMQAYLSTGDYDWKITSDFREVFERHCGYRILKRHPLEDPVMAAAVEAAVRDVKNERIVKAKSKK